MANPFLPNPARQTAIAVLAVAAAAFVVTVAHAADENIGYRWRAEGSALVVTVDGRDTFTIDGIGPLWREDKVGRGPTDAVVARQTTRGPVAETRYRTASGAEWKVVAQPSPHGEFVVKLHSADRRFDAASPGKVSKAGRWVGMDLSQYAMAYGQQQHPKTYYLPGPGLFLCAWWDAEVAHASQQNWPEALCHPRSGAGPFAPASTMQYVAGPDGRHANLHEGCTSAWPAGCGMRHCRRCAGRANTAEKWSGSSIWTTGAGKTRPT